MVYLRKTCLKILKTLLAVLGWEIKKQICTNFPTTPLPGPGPTTIDALLILKSELGMETGTYSWIAQYGHPTLFPTTLTHTPPPPISMPRLKIVRCITKFEIRRGNGDQDLLIAQSGHP